MQQWFSPREELIKIQRQIWRRNQEVIDHSVLVKELDFHRYEAAYKRAVAKFQSSSNIEEMISAILDSDIVYVGDYHTCNQSQRSFLRILKEVVKTDTRFLIGLELLHKRYQPVLDAYLSDKIPEATFLKKVGLRKHWVFDLWGNFKPLFDFARYHAIPLVAMDAAPRKSTIRMRDEATARLVFQITEKFPDRRLFVFIGDLHLAPQHLPGLVLRELNRRRISRKDLILYQNSEPIYWRLAAQGLEDQAEVVKIGDRAFCRMHTPPVICQQSYINWLEHEEGEIDFADAKSSFLELVDRLAKFLRIELGHAKDRVEVFTCGDLSFLSKIKEGNLVTNEEFARIKRQILASESYYIAKTKIVYLSNVSINHAAEEGSHFIKHICSGEEKGRHLLDAFYANILHEALGFFGSKIINHKRKCPHEKDFYNVIQYFKMRPASKERELELETALLVSEYKDLERHGKLLEEASVFENREDLFFAVTHALGYMLGDRLYYALMGGGVTKTEVRHLFYDPWRGEGKPAQVYWQLMEKARGVRIPKRM